MLRHLSTIALTAVGYFLLGEAGLLLAIPPGYATAVFPAAAVGMVAVLHCGVRTLPGVWLGSFAINFIIGSKGGEIDWSEVGLAAIIALGCCLQAWVASLLVRWRLKDRWQSLVQDDDILWFLMLAGPVACTVSASWAVVVLSLNDAIAVSEWLFTWWNWWVGDSIGVLLFAPILLIVLFRQCQPWRGRMGVVIVPTLGLTAAIVVAFVIISAKDQKLLKYRIDHYGQTLISLINAGLLTYQENIDALARLMTVSPNLSHDDFVHYTQPIFDHHADVHAMSWNPMVRHADRATFESRFGTENALNNFQITERDSNQQLVVAKPRDWYVVVGYIEPMMANIKALGYDIASNAERLSAIQVAMHSKRLTATPPIRLVQESSGSTGLLLLQPVYGKNAEAVTPLGFAVGVFKVETMLRNQVAKVLPMGLTFSVEDTGDNVSNRTLYSNHVEGKVMDPALQWTQTIDFAGRHWQMTLYPTGQFIANERSLVAWIILLLGLVAASLLQAMLLGVTGRGFAIQHQVDEQTKEISEKNKALLDNQQYLSQEKERYQILMQSSGDGIHILDLQGKVLEANSRFCELLGYSYDEIIGMSITDWEAQFDSAGAVEKVRQNVQQANVFETRHRRKDGTIIDVEVSAKAVEIGGRTLLWNASRDITERKQLQMAMLQAKEAAENAARSKARFLANMSHEIRTPMNGILGLTQLALDQSMTPELRDYLDKILLSGQTLLGILNDILDISKIEAGRMTIERTPFNLATVLDSLQNLFEARAHEKGLAFKVEIETGAPSQLLGDALRLQQVLTNLLGNALKFTESGMVQLSVTVRDRLEKQVRLHFCVTDTGIGIEPSLKDRLFKPFSQIDDSITRRFGGTGLGLAITHDLLKLMGSEIQLDSELGRGSRFSFDLSFDLSSQDGSPSGGKASVNHAGDLRQKLNNSGQTLSGLRVLVAEDNAINQIVVGKFLKLMGVSFEMANNGAEALDILANQNFDAVLMDVSMPIMDGLEATRLIRQQDKWRDLPVIALTAGITDEERQNCLICGMSDFLTKPINPESFVEVLRRFLK